MKNLLTKSFLLLPAILFATFAMAQTDDKVPVKEMMETKNFIFKAQTISPASARFRNLTGDYTFTVRPDSIIADLPFFGRAYSAPINPAEGGIKFTSTQFDYKTTNRKNKWEIDIQTRDVNGNYQLFLTVFDNGRASLRTSSTNRQTVVFDGYVVSGRPIEKKAF